MKANIGITETNANAVADILAKLLADEFLLYTKTRNAIGTLSVITFMQTTSFLKTSINNLTK
jgi:starvation-inducible DNA-binding protein